MLFFGLFDPDRLGFVIDEISENCIWIVNNKKARFGVLFLCVKILIL